MTSVTVAHISDTHLGARCTDFESNFQALLGELARTQPDLMVNTGDLTINGVGEPADHAHARRLHERLVATWRVLPGNHDIGDKPAEPGADLREPPVNS